MQTSWKEWAPYALALIATLLFVDLFLDWHRASVSVTGVVDIDAGVSAWSGWGAIAGLLLIALLLWEWWRVVARRAVQRVSTELVSLMLALGAAGFTAVEFFTGAAEVQSGTAVMVGVYGRQWPAYVGLVLAVLLALAAVVRLGRLEQHPSDRVSLGVR
jgi:hypothetical protein